MRGAPAGWFWRATSDRRGFRTVRFFFFGSLMDRDVAALVLGRPVEAGALQPGILHGYERLVVAGESYPALAPRAGGKVAGLLLHGVGDTDLARMQFFESEEFAPAAYRIELTSGGYVDAYTFVAREVLEYTDQRWDFAHWQRHEKPGYLTLARAWMNEYGRREAHQLEGTWSSRRQRQLDERASGKDCNERQSTSGGKSHE